MNNLIGNVENCLDGIGDESKYKFGGNWLRTMEIEQSISNQYALLIHEEE